MQLTATISIVFGEESAGLVLAKCHQWVEFLQASGVDATFLVQPGEAEVIEPETQPVADLWQALNREEA